MDTKTLTPRTVTLTITLNDEELSDVVITAVEGGIGYWFRGLEYRHNQPGGAFIAGYITDEVGDCDRMGDGYGYSATDDHAEQATCEDCIAATTLIDSDTVALGIQRILSGEVGIRGDLLRQVQTLTTEDPNVDSDAADCIVQAGLFGELVYG